MTAVISLNAPWLAADTLRLPEKLQPWLLEPASLTARLKAHCQQFRLALLAETTTELPDFLWPCLPAISGACVRREVLMSCNQQPAERINTTPSVKINHKSKGGIPSAASHNAHQVGHNSK